MKQNNEKKFWNGKNKFHTLKRDKKGNANDDNNSISNNDNNDIYYQHYL